MKSEVRQSHRLSVSVIFFEDHYVASVCFGFVNVIGKVLTCRSREFSYQSLGMEKRQIRKNGAAPRTYPGAAVRAS